MRRPKLADVLPVHPYTGLTAIGRRRDGSPIWPVKGGSGSAGDPAANSGSGGAPDPAQPASTPPAPTPPVPTPQEVFGTGQQPTGQPTGKPNGPNGFPENTPLVEMSSEQREAYHQYQSRKHEARAKQTYDELERVKAELAQIQTAAMSEQERAIAQARAEGRAAALADAGATLVEAHFKAALGTRMTDEQIAALLAPLDRKSFLAADGLGVDADKVSSYIAVIAPPVAPQPPAVPPAPPQPPAVPPAPPQQPTGQPDMGAQPRPPVDLGQGNHPAPKPNGLAAGRLIAAQRFGKKPPAQQ